MTTPLPGGVLATVGSFCYRRRRTVLLAWIVGALAIAVLGFGFGAASDDDFSGGHTDSALAGDLAKKYFPQDGDSLTLAIRADRGVTDAGTRAKIDGLAAKVAADPQVRSVLPPTRAPQQVSADGRTAFARVTLKESGSDVAKADVLRLVDTVRNASGGGVEFALDGQAVLTAETPSGGSSEGIGLLAAVVILLISFGSLVAMGLPILTALFGIIPGLALIGIVGYVFPAPTFSPLVAGLIGLGVGIDYALFIVTRYREGLEHGDSPHDATVTAIATAGRSVLFAGTTVVVALLGLLVMNQRLLSSTAVAASVTVFMTMAAAVTLLPALFGFTRERINRLRLPLLGRTRTASPLAERWAGVVQKRAGLAVVAASVVLLVLSVPALSMRLSFEDSSNLPKGTSGHTAHQILARGFGPGYDAPLFVFAELPPGGADLQPLVTAVRGTPGIASVTPVTYSGDRRGAQFVAYPTTAHEDAATPKLVNKLRHDVFPRELKGTGVVAHLGGPNAWTIDFAHQVGVRMPWLIAVVIVLSLILLVVLVRSLVISVSAAVMTLLSAGAAYGVLTAVAQWGWLSAPLGFQSSMPITAWVPLLMFPILFGLSTDYEVFLVGRMREEYEASGDTREAVRRGLARTARVITAAAAIMVVVFLTVLLGADAAVKQFGLGLAVAVLIDATVIRLVLVPALMELLGDRNWWLPEALGRILPKVAHEPGRTALPESVDAN
ncbi:MMPL family transporter [Actinomadura rayongensis]|uniref:MMPL family transporter n=1 Tax=Actinomadura rayongensis TaxID=1429076 RepID=A0A6I4W0R0_9ACTN|nr:MMPL family transporter [Actinomadura rayongensis]MXQ63011.1 MMPL family transporter [Actinomadura rayongensis]